VHVPARFETAAAICYSYRVITAAITGAVAAVLALFGIKPGPYLAVIALVVKGLIVLGGLLIARRVMKKRESATDERAP
jgi:hypothetical protein